LAIYGTTKAEAKPVIIKSPIVKPCALAGNATPLGIVLPKCTKSRAIVNATKNIVYAMPLLKNLIAKKYITPAISRLSMDKMIMDGKLKTSENEYCVIERYI